VGGFLCGALFGSFGNVLIYRVPRGESIVSPPSACPACGAPIRRRHNVPIFGWLWLRGRCADCSAPISMRYPLIELLTGAAFAVVVAAYGVDGATPLLWGAVFFGIVLSAIDLHERRLPTSLITAFAVYLAIVMVAISVGTGDWAMWPRVLIGAAALGLLYFAAFLAYPRGMGFGDVRLAPVLGAFLGWFGWQQLVVGTFAGFVWGALVGLAAMVATRRTRGVKIPFGPWMFVGALTGVIIGRAVANWYLGFTGLRGP
jgi:leader peptidase (prepilin peptidase) / N-methyltransferase